jgi:hypothetical protein
MVRRGDKATFADVREIISLYEALNSDKNLPNNVIIPIKVARYCLLRQLRIDWLCTNRQILEGFPDGRPVSQAAAESLTYLALAINRANSVPATSAPGPRLVWENPHFAKVSRSA